MGTGSIEEIQYLTVKEFAERAGFGARHIRRLIKGGTVQACRSEGRRKWLIPQSEVSKLRGEPAQLRQEEVQPKQTCKETDPVILKRMEQHFEHLLEIVNLLLDNEVGKVFGNPSIGDEPEADDYTIISEKSDFEQIPRSHLVERIENNIDHVLKTYSVWDFGDCFFPHLMAESPRFQDFGKLYNEHTIEFIDILRTLSRRKTFKGACPVCKDW